MHSFAALLLVALAFGVVFPPAALSAPPQPAREFRAAWIATVANIDWPSKPGLAAKKQQAELVALLDLAAGLNLNAVVMQVRPACDALYRSDLEPWSEYLTGRMGGDPGYDPLEFAVREAHARGLQLHAWFNPYRAGHASAKGPKDSLHVSHTLPDVVRQYGKQLWLDPAEPKARLHSLHVVMDVVKRYDIDGVHFDDYFYPYPVSDNQGRPIPFPDENAWRQSSPVSLENPDERRADWRRQQVNRFIHEVSQGIKQEKPHVMFGVSPFGIWRPGHPKSIVGFDAYDKLYADARLWLRKGWVDYCSPQLYWKCDSKGQSYPVLQAWWAEQNVKRRALWPGLYTSRLGNASSGWEANELLKQIKLTRNPPGAGGNIHFSIKALQRDWGGLATELRSGLYAEPALTPKMPWMSGAKRPKRPSNLTATRQDLGVAIDFSHAKQSPRLWLVQHRVDGHWHSKVIPGQTKQSKIESYSSGNLFVRAVNRLGVCGKTAKLEVQAASAAGNN